MSVAGLGFSIKRILERFEEMKFQISALIDDTNRKFYLCDIIRDFETDEIKDFYWMQYPTITFETREYSQSLVGKILEKHPTIRNLRIEETY